MDAGAGDLFVQVGDERIILRGILTDGLGVVAGSLRLRAFADPHLLNVIRVGAGQVRFVLEMPAFPALLGAQRLGAFGARGADGGEGVPARDHDLLNLAGVQVGAADLDGTDAPATGDGQVPERPRGPAATAPAPGQQAQGPGRGPGRSRVAA